MNTPQSPDIRDLYIVPRNTTETVLLLARQHYPVGREGKVVAFNTVVDRITQAVFFPRASVMITGEPFLFKKGKLPPMVCVRVKITPVDGKPVDVILPVRSNGIIEGVGFLKTEQVATGIRDTVNDIGELSGSH